MTSRYTSNAVETVRQQWQPVAERIESIFPDGIALYGAGFVGTWAANYLDSIGARIIYFFDRDTRKVSSTVNGIPIVTPTPEILSTVPAVLITARHAVREVKQALAPYGVEALSFDGYFVLRNYSRLIDIRDHYLADARSVEVFNALLIAMLNGDITPCLDVMEKDMYFCLPEFSGNFDEIFVDAGAFVGDTVERFIWENLGTFRHIHAFEPGLRQFKAMEVRMRRLAEEWAFAPETVSLVRAGLSSSSGRMACTFLEDFPLRHGLSRMGTNEAAMTVDEATDGSASVLALDDYLAGRPISFLKADVEGMEMELLRGAEQTIRRFHPKMALCVYHYPSDLYEVAEFVRSLVPEYRFALRQHAPLFGDFVLYCYV